MCQQPCLILEFPILLSCIPTQEEDEAGVWFHHGGCRLGEAVDGHVVVSANLPSPSIHGLIGSSSYRLPLQVNHWLIHLQDCMPLSTVPVTTLLDFVCAETTSRPI